MGEEALEAVDAAGGGWEEVHAEVDDFGGWHIGADHFVIETSTRVPI